MTAPDLAAILAAQRAAAAQGAPDYGHRMRALAALRDALHARHDDLLRAVSDDFGGRAPAETRLLELFPLLDQIRHARRRLKRWMRRHPVRSTWYLWPARAFYQYQPLGVAGIIGAWNYPLLLTLGPLVDAIAAGNRVMLKPSEITPRSAELIARIIADTFPPDYIACVTGGPAVAGEFAALPFDHILFTGSARVGRLVMQSAAANLTPVTLELGGKSPAIVHESFPADVAAERILMGKLYNAGQTCVAPDYVLLPERHVALFERAARSTVRELYPSLARSDDYTRIVDDAHFRRLQELLDEARSAGAEVIPLADVPGGGAGRVVTPTLVLGATDEMRIMKEEIFGPVLPLVVVPDVDRAIDYVNRRPRPLALYYFDHDRKRGERLLSATMSGGVTINDCVYHLGQLELPFGGVGASGMGAYHGFDGFATFSKKRAVMVRRRWSATDFFRPPWQRRLRLVDAVLRLARR